MQVADFDFHHYIWKQWSRVVRPNLRRTDRFQRWLNSQLNDTIVADPKYPTSGHFYVHKPYNGESYLSRLT